MSGHYHIKIPDHMYKPRSVRTLRKFYSRLRQDNIWPDVHSDFSRLARMIRGCSVALVLGGGGARGCSHIGMVKVRFLDKIFKTLISMFIMPTLVDAGGRYSD